MTTSPSLQRFLLTMEYPATKDDLLREARRDELAPADCSALKALPERSFSASWQVSLALREPAEAAVLLAA